MSVVSPLQVVLQHHYELLSRLQLANDGVATWMLLQSGIPCMLSKAHPSCTPGQIEQFPQPGTAH